MLFRIEVSAADHERAADLLWVRGATGIEERSDCLIAGFDHEPDLSGLPWPAATVTPNEEWVEAQRDAIGITRVPPLVVHPPWLQPRLATGERAIVIDPGPAFGHGGHPTTALCLELLIGTAVDRRIVGDVGSGTGVLGIAAAVLGARRVWATEIDPGARAMTATNASANDVEIDQLEAPAEADLALVNVTVDVHELVAPTVAAPEVIISGILSGQIERVETAYQGSLVDRREQDGWIAGRIQPSG